MSRAKSPGREEVGPGQMLHPESNDREPEVTTHKSFKQWLLRSRNAQDFTEEGS